MIPEQGWQCPLCKRIYNPRQEMCLYCGGEGKKVSDITKTDPRLSDLNTVTTPYIDKISSNDLELKTNGTKGSPYYTTTTDFLNAKEIPIPDEIPTVTLCSGYDTKNKICNGGKEPFQSDYAGDLKKCTEY